VKIRPVGAEMFHVDRRTTQTDMTKLIVTFAILQTCLKMTPVCWRYSLHRVFLFAAPQCEMGVLCLISHIHWMDNAYEKWILLNKMCVQYSCKLCIMGKSQ